MKFDTAIFYDMIEEGIIPKDGVFVITEDMQRSYVLRYAEHCGAGNTKTKSNEMYAMKLAGLSLLKLNTQREDQQEVVVKRTVSKTSSGIVYLISNPAFDGFLKIGITKDLKSRLSSYQTYDPFKRFKVEHYRVVADARKEEKLYLSHHNITLAKGEWVHRENVKEIFLAKFENSC